MKTDELKKKWESAKEYVAKIGKPEPHLRSVGKLHSVDVITQICHQASPSATNYWKDMDFDAALDRVIMARFQELANVALEVMEEAYKEALLAEKKHLQERLAAIQAIEEGR